MAMSPVLLTSILHAVGWVLKLLTLGLEWQAALLTADRVYRRQLVSAPRA